MNHHHASPPRDIINHLQDGRSSAEIFGLDEIPQNRKVLVSPAMMIVTHGKNINSDDSFQRQQPYIRKRP
jgi:hypothetical protein